MNVGQILETHMGWACRGLGRIIDEALQQYPRERPRPSSCARRWPRSTATTRSRRTIKDDELVEIADKLTKGVPIATPVFDGAASRTSSRC